MNSQPLDKQKPLRDSVQETRRKRFIQWGLMGCVLIAGLLLLLTLTFLKSFSLKILPLEAANQADVTSHSGWAVAIKSRMLLLSDATTVRVESNGYYPYEQRITKSGEQMLTIELVPRPGIAVIEVESESPFEVSMNGNSLGSLHTTEVELMGGVHSLRISGPQIVTIRKELEIRGLEERQTFEFKTRPSLSRVSIRTMPIDAVIEIDGQFASRGQYIGGIDTGAHTVQVHAENYIPKDLTFSSIEDGIVDLGVIKLEPLPALLKIRTEPSIATILLNGKYVGRSPMSTEIAPSTTTQVSIRKFGHQTFDTEIRLSPGEEKEISVALNQIPIRIRVETTPAATILLNGTRKGLSPLDLVAFPGDRVEVSKSGHQSRSTIVNPLKGEQQTLFFELFDPLTHAFKFAENELVIHGGMRLKKVPTVSYQLDVSNVDAAGAIQTGTREIELTRPFYIGMHEVTYGAYLAFDPDANPGIKPSNSPVTDISWKKAAHFCNWLSNQDGLEPVYVFGLGNKLVRVHKDGLGYRLPTEAEWDAVAHVDLETGRVVTPYPWGTREKIPNGFANLAGYEMRNMNLPFMPDYVDKHAGPAPVGSYPANFNGVFDLYGNVSEWVHNYYEGQSAGLNQRLVDPLGPEPGAGIDHVVKGANYLSHRTDKLFAYLRAVQSTGKGTTGFRVARWIY